MNVVILTGRLTRDPELKYGQSGKAYSRFSIAVDRPFQKDEVDFINCVAFGKTAEFIGEYFRKGKKIALNGRMQMNQYEKEGEKRTTYDVVVDSVEFADSKTSDSPGNFSSFEKRENPSPSSKKEVDSDFNSENAEDEFPF